MPTNRIYEALAHLARDRRAYCGGYSMISVETAILLVALGWARWVQMNHELEITPLGETVHRKDRTPKDPT